MRNVFIVLCLLAVATGCATNKQLSAINGRVEKLEWHVRDSAIHVKQSWAITNKQEQIIHYLKNQHKNCDCWICEEFKE